MGQNQAKDGTHSSQTLTKKAGTRKEKAIKHQATIKSYGSQVSSESENGFTLPWSMRSDGANETIEETIERPGASDSDRINGEVFYAVVTSKFVKWLEESYWLINLKLTPL